jgi:hypothetical protein
LGDIERRTIAICGAVPPSLGVKLMSDREQSNVRSSPVIRGCPFLESVGDCGTQGTLYIQSCPAWHSVFPATMPVRLVSSAPWRQSSAKGERRPGAPLHVKAKDRLCFSQLDELGRSEFALFTHRVRRPSPVSLRLASPLLGRFVLNRAASARNLKICGGQKTISMGISP